MNIWRKSERETDFKTIAQVVSTDAHNPEIPVVAPSDVRDRNATVSLGLDTVTFTNSQLKVQFPAQNIVREDKGIYKCSVTYTDSIGVTQTDEVNTTFSVYGMFSLAHI